MTRTVSRLWTAHRRRSHRCGLHGRCCARDGRRTCACKRHRRHPWQRKPHQWPRTARRRRLAVQRATGHRSSPSRSGFAVYNRSGQTVKVYDANKDRTTAVVPGDRVYLSGSSFLGPDIEGSMKFENGITTNFWANNHDLWWPGVQFDDDNFNYSEYEAHPTPLVITQSPCLDADWDRFHLHGADQLLSVSCCP